jgi:curved DNA-binding protein CbpA
MNYRCPDEFVAQAKIGGTTAMMLLLILYYCDLIEIADLKQAQPFGRMEEKQDPRSQFADKRTDLPVGFMEKVKEKIEQIKKGDLLALLGLTSDFDEAQLKHVFLELSKSFHPDRLGIAGDDELRQVLNFVVSKINEAFGTLSNPTHREIYLKTIPSKPGEKRKPDPDAALVEYEKAKVFINKKNLVEAAKQLRLAHELDPDKAEYNARMIWFEYLCESPQDSEKRLNVKIEMEKMFRDAPGNFYINRYLATIFKELQDNEQYKKHLQKANSIRPTDIETARELRLLNTRKQKKNS